jgi:hypothetical protein
MGLLESENPQRNLRGNKMTGNINVLPKWARKEILDLREKVRTLKKLSEEWEKLYNHEREKR